jgi:anthranilate phosphoribosyltransferase
LLGGDPAQNAAELKAVLSGAGRPAYRDAVLLNTAAALVVADAVQNLKDGVERARKSIDSGAAMAKVTGLAAVSPVA